jgi:hypothetical protein
MIIDERVASLPTPAYFTLVDRRITEAVSERAPSRPLFVDAPDQAIAPTGDRDERERARWAASEQQRIPVPFGTVEHRGTTECTPKLTFRPRSLPTPTMV